jgi:hypothetical protein
MCHSSLLFKALSNCPAAAQNMSVCGSVKQLPHDLAAADGALLACSVCTNALMSSQLSVVHFSHMQAKLHEAQGQRSAAAHYYALNLARLDAEGVTGTDATEALLYLAEYAKVCH